MKTSELIETIEVGEVAYSKSLGIYVKYSEEDGVYIVLKESDIFSDVVKLNLSSRVMKTKDWEIETEFITDFNEIVKLMDTAEGVTMFGRGFCHYYNYSHKASLISMGRLTKAKFIKGKYSMSKLRTRGLV